MADAGPALHDHDESERIAVKALGDMRNNAQLQRADDSLIEYRRPSSGERTTATSPPTTLGANWPTSTSESSPPDSHISGRPKVKLKSENGSAIDDTPDPKDDLALGKTWKGKGCLQISSPFIGPPPPPPELASSSSSSVHTEERQVVQRSRWQAVLLEAGGLSAALSEESMRRLKYCLQWLQYATAHIDAQILILRDFTASLQPLPSQTRAAHPPISQAHLRTLHAVRRDIVQTVKQVVDVVSNLDMMRGVTGVVKDSLDRADAWVGRFRTVGLQRGERQADPDSGPPSGTDGDMDMEGSEFELEFTRMRHRRGASSGSLFDDRDGMPSPFSGSSSYSSYAGGSVPSTPDVGAYVPMHAYSQSGGASAQNLPSLNAMGLGLSAMSLNGSRYGTPRSVAGRLPDEDELQEERVVRQGKEAELQEVKIVGMDVEGEAEDGADQGGDKAPGKMDVDA
ncbi:hypothetical protein DXG03_008775 [Asterophora parasitica]|uniref:Uncharacterized protein n=1 Tax=Asterophora parasitica TaxID=117018 RepID=A0A9P7K8S9_9AGAR|nr:hypothetical protein DXG03_008775 [Asterophora parasitica]